MVLIFDEVTTNFRYGSNGIQDFVGVVPDLACFAKAISNGYAMGAVVGRRWVMEPAADMFVSSTYWSDLVGITAAITTLTEIERRDVPAQLADYGRALAVGHAGSAGRGGAARRDLGHAGDRQASRSPRRSMPMNPRS